MCLSFFTGKMGMIIIELTHEVIVRRQIGVNKQCLEHSMLYLSVWYYDYFIFILMIVKLLSSTEQGVCYNRLGLIIQMNSVLHCTTWKIMQLPHNATNQINFRFFSFGAVCRVISKPTEKINLTTPSTANSISQFGLST